MASTTGIELSPDSCVLVRARPARDGAEVSAFHVIHRGEWPSHDVAAAGMIRAIRRRLRFPRRARVVAWGLPEDLPADNPIVTALVKPVTAAGFRVESVLSPPQALAALARMRPRGSGTTTAWIAANVQGAAVAIVRDGELLYSRTLDWAYRQATGGTKAELLQRYSLVAHLGPEVRHGVSAVRASHGATVERVVTCGDLPDLRSLTMPLIEELDLEVETLDSTEGFVLASRGASDRFVELAPALRLACAAATGRTWRARRLMPLGAAAALVVLAGAAWAGFFYRQPFARATGTQPASPAAPAASKPASAPPSAEDRSGVPADRGGSPATTSPRAAGTAGGARGTRSTVIQPSRPARPSTSPPSDDALAFPSQAPASVISSRPKPTATVGEASPRESAAPTGLQRSAQGPGLPVGAPPPPSFSAHVRTTDGERTLPPPLDAPLPAIDSILISHDRRLAVIGRSIVGVGDAVGPRVVVAIERDAVVFREPSGREVRVPLRSGPGRP